VIWAVQNGYLDNVPVERTKEYQTKVIVQTVQGQITVLPQHVRSMTQLAAGELVVSKAVRDQFLATGEGLVAVTGDHVAIATDMAIPAEKIDEAKAEEMRERALARLKEKLSSEEIASVNAALARSLAQLKVKRRHHT